MCSLLTVRAATQQPADSVQTGWRIQSRFHYGFVMSHTKKMGHLITQHSRAAELCVSQQTRGTRSWERAYNYPEKGLMLFYTELGNPVLLGHGLGFAPYIHLPLGGNFPAVTRLRIATGPGWVEKTFDRIENHKNTAMSSHINIFIQLMWDARWKLSDRLNLHAGIGLSHFSNGAFKTPNLGLNLMTVNTGFSWGTSGQSQTVVHDAPEPVDHAWQASLTLGGGLKEIVPPGTDKYRACTAILALSRRGGLKGEYGAALEGFYDASVYHQALADSIDIGSEAAGTRMGVSVYGGLVMGRLHVLLFQGAYLVAAYPARKPIFHRLAIRYDVNDHWYANFSLKTHLFDADYLELGAGFRMPVKKKKGAG
ncbi:MAG: acyloxyacyl hydrolase [Flavobacteriales bacterium]|nr:acyloxyacyl hydrolase [Flavobacteriales bacterium]